MSIYSEKKLFIIKINALNPKSIQSYFLYQKSFLKKNHWCKGREKLSQKYQKWE